MNASINLDRFGRVTGRWGMFDYVWFCLEEMAGGRRSSRSSLLHAALDSMQRLNKYSTVEQ